MGWQISGGPACAKVVNPSRTATVLSARRKRACAFISWFPQFADLTHASRDAGRKETVNKPTRRYADETGGLITRWNAPGYFSRTGVAVPAQERSQCRQTEMSSNPSSLWSEW